MAEITGTVDGFAYLVSCIRVEPCSIHASAVVHDANGRRCGEPIVTLSGTSPTSMPRWRYAVGLSAPLGKVLTLRADVTQPR